MRSPLAVALVLSCLASFPLQAQEVPNLGTWHVTAALNSMIMQHVSFESDDAGLQCVLAGYRHVGRDWYAGLELGAGGSLGIFGAQSDMTSWEFNAKKMFPVGRVLRFDGGGGLSLNRVHYDEARWFSSQDDVEIDDWVPGMQLLTNAHLRLGSVILGLNLKYQLTGDVDGVKEVEQLNDGWDYSNFTAGVHAGCGF